MTSLRSLEFTHEEVDRLKNALLEQEAIFSASSNPKLFTQLVAYGIQQEVGTVNDELARFIYDAKTGEGIPRQTLQSKMVEYRGHLGVRIWTTQGNSLDIRLKGIRELLHPTFSFNPDGSIRECVFFPESLFKIAALQNAELVIVRSWALNTIFGGFDRTKLFYETNAWELVHHDSLRYSELLANRQIALLGTHDLTAHLAGLSKNALTKLQILGRDTQNIFLRYFQSMKRPAVYSLVIPYAAGVLLDDLAQPRNYDSAGRRFIFDQLIKVLEDRMIDPEKPLLLTRFPSTYEKVIQLARSSELHRIQSEGPSLCKELVSEIRRNSIEIDHPRYPFKYPQTVS